MSLADLRLALQDDVRLGAVSLLGAHLVHGDRVARIVETEAYRGADDPGSHAFRGPTPRCQTMFGPAGFAYVYFTYGMHWMLNVSSLPQGQGAAVLIRAAEPIAGIDTMRALRPKASRLQDLLAGPARLCAAFGIDKRHDGVHLLEPHGDLRIEQGEPPRNILHGPRIGLSDGKGEQTLWRFADADGLTWVSSPRQHLRPLNQDPRTIDHRLSGRNRAIDAFRRPTQEVHRQPRRNRKQH